MRVLSPLLLLTALLPSADAEVRSRAPVDVVLDYTYHTGHLHNGAGAPLYPLNEKYWTTFVAELKKSPPEVLIVGKEAPFTHSLGPIASYGGENQTFPRIDGKDGRVLLSPDGLRQRIAAIRRFTETVHAAGVRTVAPYVSLITLFGEPEKRLGFWEFLDRWDVYAGPFSLGARPSGDPLGWCQRDAKGEIYFKWGPDKPHYKPLRRYSTCVNQPGWREWLRSMTRWIAEVGYDGLWIDNAVEQRCYCSRCQEAAEKLGNPLVPPTTPPGDLAARKPQRVWLESHLAAWDELRAVGRQVRPDFGIYVNYIELPHNREVTTHAELCMIEHCWLGAARLLWPGGIWSGRYPALPNDRVLHNRTAPLAEPRVFDNLWAFQLALAMRGEKGVHWLYGGPAARRPELEHNADSALLCLAEAAAFGGGTGVNIMPQEPFTALESAAAANAARQQFFRQFLPKHRDLFQGLRPAGQVAVIVFPNGPTEALLEAQMVHDALQWQGLLVDVLDGARLEASELQHYACLLLPGNLPLPSALAGMGPQVLVSKDPITREDWKPVAKAYSRGQPIRPLRKTSLVKAALELGRQVTPVVRCTTQDRIQACAWEKAGLTVLHVLNFNVPIGRGEANKVSAVPLDIELTVPLRRTVDKVLISSPQREGSQVLPYQQVEFGVPAGPRTFRAAGSTLKLRLPKLRIYDLIEIRWNAPLVDRSELGPKAR